VTAVFSQGETMTTSVSPTKDNPIVAVDGAFSVWNKDGTGEERITFTALLVRIGIRSLDSGRESFATQFSVSEERVKQMEELNAISAKVAAIRNAFSSDAKSSDACGKTDESNAISALMTNFNAKYPNNQLAGDKSANYTKAQIMTLESNIQSLSGTLTTQSEQQTTRTNQAMNRSSNFLQQLQTMMQAAKDALATAARTGSAG
jgi:hypothetical protein